MAGFRSEGRSIVWGLGNLGFLSFTRWFKVTFERVTWTHHPKKVTFSQNCQGCFTQSDSCSSTRQEKNVVRWLVRIFTKCQSFAEVSRLQDLICFIQNTLTLCFVATKKLFATRRLGWCGSKIFQKHDATHPDCFLTFPLVARLPLRFFFRWAEGAIATWKSNKKY